jgi:hypothetical protein
MEKKPHGPAETYTCRKKQCERNTSRKINDKQQLLDILKAKNEHTDEDKTSLLSLVPGLKKMDDDRSIGRRWKCWELRRQEKKMFQPQYAQL